MTDQSLGREWCCLCLALIASSLEFQGFVCPPLGGPLHSMEFITKNDGGKVESKALEGDSRMKTGCEIGV